MRSTRIRSYALAVALLAATPAAADDSVCVGLEAQLAEIDRGPANGDPRQFDGPIAQQQDQIDRAIAEAHRAGCMGGFLFFKPTPDPKCGQLMATIGKMQANLQRLAQQRAQMGGDPYTLASERSDVLRALSQNRCGGNYAGDDSLQNDGGGLFSALFGRPPAQDEEPAPTDQGFGTYRTLCVRICDGFYFPISFSTVPGQFSADAATCQAMCPGAPVALYTHRNPGEDVDQMVSLDGQPYTALPNAFRFRTQYDKTCTCHSTTVAAPAFTQFPADSGLSPITGAPIEATAAGPTPPLPNLRPTDAGEDPETLADRAGDLVPGPVTPVKPDAAPAADGSAAPRTVRIVGPNYYDATVP
jgi:hypothetical protein